VVTANYTLSFDAVRTALKGVDSYLLVLDTKGVNVWCAAGKGTFGTDELVQRVEECALRKLVTHRVLILPQLGATGVCASEVSKRTGFTVSWGPVRASDLPEFIRSRSAISVSARRVQFNLWDRAVLIPVELKEVVLPALLLSVCLLCVFGRIESLSGLVACLTGTLLFPIFLPLLPFTYFFLNGFLLGSLVAVLEACLWASGTVIPASPSVYLATLFATPFISALEALLFTGATTFASKSTTARETLAFLSLVPPLARRAKKFYSTEKTLTLDSDLCNGCRTCTTVCPHAVFAPARGKVLINHLEDCMECGACALNCPQKAIKVEAGVGCAWAIINSAISGSKDVVCCD
jgi:NAD-dependent dihydropyrimidine dehydrogenase PreA subunit